MDIVTWVLLLVLLFIQWKMLHVLIMAATDHVRRSRAEEAVHAEILEVLREIRQELQRRPGQAPGNS